MNVLNMLLRPEVLVFMIPITAIVGGILLSALKVISGSKTPASPQSDEETQLLQEIHRSLAKMERRVETLETLLMDEARLKSDERQVR
jgi:phage shock protein B